MKFNIEIPKSNVIDLKEAVLDYKPGHCSPQIRLHALEVYQYIERIECGYLNPEPLKNTIGFKDFALLSKKDEV